MGGKWLVNMLIRGTRPSGQYSRSVVRYNRGGFADEALGLVEDNAIIYADATTVGPLLLARQVTRRRPDVKIVSGTVNSENAPRFDAHTFEQLLKSGPIYVVSPEPGYCPAFVLEDYNFVPVGILWRVVEPKK